MATSPSPDAQSPPRSGLASRFRFRAYADADYLHSDEPGTPNNFSVGEIVLFATAAIAPKLSALAEVVLDTDSASSVAAVPVNVERLLLQYRANDFLNLEAGQYRTAIGYYSTAYLRGAWFQTAISRPRMFAFEEDGGILPLHTVGVSVSGLVPSGALGLHYVVEGGNTRNWSSPGTTDATGHNAINFSLYARPRSVPGLQVGFSDYHDRLSPFTGLTVDRSVITAHAVYTANRIEFLNEGVVGRIRDSAVHANGEISGFYSQLAYRVGPNWGPYVRIEKMSSHADPFFNALNGLTAWRSVYTGGVRYDWNDFVALKFEAAHEADWGAPSYLSLAAQIAFAF